MVSARLCFFEDIYSPLNYTKAGHTDSLKQKSLHNLQQKSLYRIQQLTIDHTVRQCTCISKANPDISIRVPALFQKPLFLEISKDTKT
jgi:hypothetical protein